MSARGGLSCTRTFGSPEFVGRFGLSFIRCRVVGSPHLMGQLGLSVTRSRVVGSPHIMGQLGLSVTRTRVGLSVTHPMGGLSVTHPMGGLAVTQSLGGRCLSAPVLPWSLMLPPLMMSSWSGYHTPYVSLPHRRLRLWCLSLPVGHLGPLLLLLQLHRHHMGQTHRSWLRRRLSLHPLLLPSSSTFLPCLLS